MAKSLFDEMLRSAANQFARDGGKVLSNAVYGDSHSTPLRRVGGSNNARGVSTSSENGEDISAEDMRQWCIENGMYLKISRTAVSQVVGIAIIGAIPMLVTGIVCGPAFLFASLRRIWYFFTADAQYARRAMIANKIPDKRYSLGYRIEGYRKGYEIIEIPPTIRERLWHLLIAFIYALIGIGIIYWNYIAFEYINSIEA
ncbi:MAG: hypothetical protein IKA07_02065 [Alistipes sp.]|nr:hypothetical protein [Alistipes sp.]